MSEATRLTIVAAVLCCFSVWSYIVWPPWLLFTPFLLVVFWLACRDRYDRAGSQGAHPREGGIPPEEPDPYA